MRRKKQQEEYDRIRESEGKKTCANCGTEFTRRRYESRTIFDSRECCDRKCAIEKRKKEKREEIAKEKKVCEACGEEFTRTVDRKHVESPQAFEKRRTCGKDCSARKKKEEHPWDKKGSGGGKRAEVSTLPPVEDCPTPIPPPPEPKFETVWRPGSWGGPYKRQVG